MSTARTVDQKNYQYLKILRPKDGLLEVVLSNPGKLNSVTAEGHDELGRIWAEIDRDESVQVVLLRGEGGTYSAGGDLKLVEQLNTDWAARMRGWKEASDIVYGVVNCAKPTVCAFENVAVGAGLAAGLLCDITIAGRSTRIIDGHTRLGVAAGDHAAIIWPLLIGMAKAKYYLMLCETLKGEEAERMGLVSMVADDDKVLTTAYGVCDKLLGGAQTAIRFTKHSLNNWLRMAGPTFDASLALEFLGFTGPEVTEGRASHVEKRRPKFPPKAPY
ncbi:MAG: enoyl-CoA hydratase/isomerase family protein [Proteobacteria bacterium]|nr:enoyl-CoA hydratase/isomerase family protein [Pseudomonadota bacterium]